MSRFTINEKEQKYPFLKGQLQGQAAHQERGKHGKWTLPAFTALLTGGERTLSDAPHAQDNLSKLLAALSAIAAPNLI